ncbi:MAG: hypothetical protein RIS86_359, partial [Planctomycetota bacterium]
MRRAARRLLLSTAAWLAIGPLAAAAPPDRSDLGRAYLRFESACAAAPREAALRERLNRGFDSLTADFFAGRTAEVLSALARIGCELEPARCAAWRFATSHRIAVEPLVLGAGSGGRIAIRCEPLDGVDAGVDAGEAPSDAWRWRARFADGRLVEAPFSSDAVLPIPLDAAAGAVEIALLPPDGEAGMLPVGRSAVLSEAPETLVARLAARIGGLGKAD